MPYNDTNLATTVARKICPRADHPDDRREAHLVVGEHAPHHCSEDCAGQHGLDQRPDSEPGRCRIGRSDEHDPGHPEHGQHDDPAAVPADPRRREPRSQRQQVRRGAGHRRPHVVGTTRQQEGDQQEEQQRPEVIRPRNQPPSRVHRARVRPREQSGRVTSRAGPRADGGRWRIRHERHHARAASPPVRTRGRG